MKKIGVSTIIILTILALLMSIQSSKKFVEIDLKASFSSKKEDIEKYFTSINYGVDVLEIIATKFLYNEVFLDSVDISYLEYDEQSDSFNADNYQSAIPIEKRTNITGYGKIDENKFKEIELKLATYLMPFFYEFHIKHLDAPWIYYTSKNKFTALYPYTPSSSFHYSDTISEMEFLTLGEKAVNPKRSSFWSHPYYDLAFNELMITSSKPIDYYGKYLGTISIDLLAGELNKLFEEEPDLTYFLTTKNGVIVSSNYKNLDYTSLNNIKSVVESFGQSSSSLTNMKNDQLNYFGEFLTIKGEMENANFDLYLSVSSNRYFILIFNRLKVLLLIIILLNFMAFALSKSISSEKLLKVEREKLDVASKVDPLTKLLNRRGFEFKAADMIKNNKIYILMLDIDHFKKVNDTYGHGGGDYILYCFAKILTDNIGNTDIVGRWGGEEFIIFLNVSDYNIALDTAEKIRTNVESYIFQFENNKIKITTSIGICCYNIEIGIEKSIELADQALYHAKNSGRNRTHFCQSDCSYI